MNKNTNKAISLTNNLQTRLADHHTPISLVPDTYHHAQMGDFNTLEGYNEGHLGWFVVDVGDVFMVTLWPVAILLVHRILNGREGGGNETLHIVGAVSEVICTLECPYTQCSRVVYMLAAGRDVAKHMWMWRLTIKELLSPAPPCLWVPLTSKTRCILKIFVMVLINI